MKICQIKLKNIHSLKGEHTIDFENGVLGDAGLFVITGPTGAGKSTILDVITLALFNRIPRISASISKKVIEEEGVIMTKNTSDCYAEVEYLVNDILYRSNWSIRLTRNNTLAERLHEIVDVTNGNTIISSAISQVPKENERIIGLSYEQFVQSMILAQGQFSKLLLAKRDDRNTLLEEITGTGFYRTIGRNVFNRFKEEEKKVNIHQIKMGENKLFSEEDILLINEKIKSEKPVLEEFKLKANLLDSKKKVKESILKNIQKKLENKDLFDKLNSDKEDFKPRLNRLDEHSKFALFRNSWEDLKRKQKAQIEISNQLKMIELDNSNLNNQLTHILTTGSELIKKDIDLQSFDSSFDFFQAKVLQLQEEERSQNQKIEYENQRIIERIAQLNRFGFTLFNTNELPSQIDDSLQQIENKTTTEKIAVLHDIQVLKSNLTLLRLPASKLIGSKKLFQEKTDALEKLKTLLKDQTDALGLKKEENIQSVEKLKELNLKYEEALQLYENSKKIKGFEAYRSELKEDCPCPLCGSEDHPYVVDNQYGEKFDIHEENFNNVKKIVESTNNSILIRTTEISNLERSIESNGKDLAVKDKEVKEVKLELEQLSKELGWSNTLSLIEIEQKSKDIDVQFEKFSQLEKLIEAKQILIDLKEIYSVFIALTHSFQAVKKERVSLFDGGSVLEVVSKFKSQKNSTQQQIETNAKLIQNHTETINQNSILIENESALLIEKVSVLGLERLEELDLKIIREEEVIVLRDQVKSINDRELTLKANLDTIEKELSEDKEMDDETLSLEEINTTLKTLLEEVEILKKSIWESENQLEIDKEKREKQNEDQLILDALKRDLNLWSKMNALIGDATGKKFSNFVQDLTLKQLIEYGNARLKGFSDRYLLEVENEAENLKVIDTYMGNSQRAVSSLSGGETFKLSLALAFGLSDLAAKNVNIESLFIDEGFGTLDPESLDQAITILENMQNTTNKSIGIISHVGELKDRIGTKIKLVRSGAGYSSIEIE